MMNYFMTFIMELILFFESIHHRSYFIICLFYFKYVCHAQFNPLEQVIEFQEWQF